MKIKEICCEQFAGIRDKRACFDDGMNVIYGKNESGKSTLVNLLSRTLFQNSKINHKKDSEFENTYFPSERRNTSIVGDSIDGQVIFETEKGTYTISKEWRKNAREARCKLSVPEGVIREQSAIDAALKEALIYGEGVYAEMLFSSQRNTDKALQTILNTENTDTKQEIVKAVSLAFAESDGAAIDDIERAIQGKIDGIAGKNWDCRRSMPKDKKNSPGKLSKGLGEIGDLYYALENAKKALDEIEDMEDRLEEAVKKFNTADEAAQKARDEYEELNKYAGKLKMRKVNEDRAGDLNKNLKKYSEDYKRWCELPEKLDTAKNLREEKSNRECLDKYERAKEITGKIASLRSSVDGKGRPDEAEITAVRDLQFDIAGLESRLCGVDLNAAVKMFGEASIEITSVLTGRSIDIIDGVCRIDEAVRISVPGVMEMQLSPADVNAEEIEEEIREKKQRINDIFGKYSVTTLKELKELAEEFNRVEREIKTAELRELMPILGDTDYDGLKAQAEAITEPVREKEKIEADIVSVCAGSDVNRYIAGNELIIAGYENDYGDLEKLQSKIGENKEELERVKNELAEIKDIPEEYLGIDNPNLRLKELKDTADRSDMEREAALVVRTNAQRDLEKEGSLDELRDKKDEAERIFNEKNTELAQWRHIQEVFNEQKEELRSNPMHDLADRFMEYLGIISDNKISSEFENEDKLDPQIYSGSVKLDYGKLSEGTKETVSFAFRLAVLDHLFPNGGGVIVLDDSFTDMDAERAQASCELLKECAKRHQVIFLTCREDYIELLGGNVIRW